MEESAGRGDGDDLESMRSETIGKFEATNSTERSSSASSSSSAVPLEEQLPPLSAYLGRAKFWWNVATVPAVFIVINIFVLGNMADDYDDSDVFELSRDLHRDRASAIQRMIPFLLIAVLTADVILIFLAARYVERQILQLKEHEAKELEREEKNQGLGSSDPPATVSPPADDNSNFIYARASKMFDIFFSRSNQVHRPLPKISFFVNLLYALMALFLTADVSALASFVSLPICSSRGTEAAEQDASKNIRGIASTTSMDGTNTQDNSTSTPEVPLDILRWATYQGFAGHFHDEMDLDPYDEEPRTYMQTSNGISFFAGLDPNADLNVGSRPSMHRRSTHHRRRRNPRNHKILLAAHRNGTWERYPTVESPRQFAAITHENKLDEQDEKDENHNPDSREQVSKGTDAFCCLYKHIEPEDTEDYADDYFSPEDPRFNDHILCYDAVEGTFRSASLDPADRDHEKKGIVVDGMKVSPTSWLMVNWEDQLWLRSEWDTPSSNRVVVVSKFDFPTMDLTKVRMLKEGDSDFDRIRPLDIRVSKAVVYRVDPECKMIFLWFSEAAGVAVLSLTAWWLLWRRRIPSGMAPLCLVGIVLLTNIDPLLALLVGSVAVVTILVTLLDNRSLSSSSPIVKAVPWITRDMLLWAIYTLLILLLLPSLDMPLPWNTDYTEDSVIPILLWLVVGLVLNHPILQLTGWSGAIVSVVTGVMDGEIIGLLAGLVIGFGVASLGYTVSKYRAYVIAHSRRFWRALELTSTISSPSTSSRAN